MDELRICRSVVLAEGLVDSLAKVPLLTQVEGRELLDAHRRGEKEVVRALLFRAKENKNAREWYVREGRRWSLQEVAAAALSVEAAVQWRLRQLGGLGTLVPLRLARPLWDAQWQAHAAVVVLTGKRKPAKELQRQAAGDNEPLTVCVGYRARRFKPDHEAVMRANAPDMFTEEHPGYVPFVPLGYGDGCGLIILDSVEPRKPKRYCVSCAKKAQHTLNGGLAKNALARLRAGRSHI